MLATEIAGVSEEALPSAQLHAAKDECLQQRPRLALEAHTATASGKTLFIAVQKVHAQARHAPLGADLMTSRSQRP